MLYDLIRLRCQRKVKDRWCTVKVVYTEDEAIDWYHREKKYDFPIRIIAEGFMVFDSSDFSGIKPCGVFGLD